MSFNGGKFNEMKFGFTGEKVLLELLTAKAYCFAGDMMAIKMQIELLAAEGISGGDLDLTVRIPIGLSGAAAVSRADTGLLIRLFELTTIDLSGLSLLPGETLMIDSEAVTAEKNGVNAIEFWQAGSMPFYLKNGENVILYYDSISSRRANMSVIWRDRYL